MSNEDRLPAMADHYRSLLNLVGEDPQREGLLKTPERAAKAFEFLTSGYQMSVEEVLNEAVFDESYDDMVVVKDIEFYSLCEHHLLPFYGRCHVAYLPGEKIIGISKVARLVEVFARRLQVQERMTEQIANALECAILPRGVAVVAQARHLCMMARGIEKQNSEVVTSAVLGAFRHEHATRAEFMDLLNLRNV